MSIPPLSEEKLKELEQMDQAQLMTRRAALIAAGKPDELGDSDLQELCTIFDLLRRRSSGPPVASKAKKGTALNTMSTLDKLGSLL